MFRLFILSLLLALISCKEKPLGDFLTNDNYSHSEKIEIYLTRSNLLNKFSTAHQKTLKEVFKQRNYQGVLYSDNDTLVSMRGKNLKKLINNSLQFGVPTELLLHEPNKLHRVEQEFYCIINLMKVIKLRSEGFSISEIKVTEKDPKELIQDVITLSKTDNYNQLCKNVLGHGPREIPQFEKLSNSIFTYCQNYNIDTTSYKLTNYKTEPARKKLAVKSLFNKGYIESINPSNDQINRALLTFKIHNCLDSSYELNDYTTEALCESNHNRLTRAAITLNKIRFSKAMGARYVHINIPEYMLYFVNKNELQAKHRIVVGKRKTQTPELESEITRIIVFPDWRVPPSIVKHEILPSARKNINYLSKHHYKLYKKGDTSAIDVSTLNGSLNNIYSIVQTPGTWNSLGVIKFEFINKFSVYVHDTPQKALFNRQIRSFSHGCMRCQKPIELGKTIIENDQEGRLRNALTADSLESFIKKGDHKPVYLKRKIPIFVTYYSVTNHSGKIYFHLDIYSRDQKIINGLKSQVIRA